MALQVFIGQGKNAVTLSIAATVSSPVAAVARETKHSIGCGCHSDTTTLIILLATGTCRVAPQLVETVHRARDGVLDGGRERGLQVDGI